MPLVCGAYSPTVDVRGTLEGDPVVGRPITVSLAFAVPPDSVFFDLGDESAATMAEANVVATISSAGHYDILRTDPPCPTCGAFRRSFARAPS